MAEWLDENEAAKLLALAKHVDQEVRWKSHGGYQTVSMEVLSDEESYEMTLQSSFTEQTGYFKLSLFVGSQPIAMLHAGKVHHNPDSTRLTGKIHKHRWTDAHREKSAYEPADIDVSSTEGMFRSFLKECNIELRGRFNVPQVQRRLL